MTGLTLFVQDQRDLQLRYYYVVRNSASVEFSGLTNVRWIPRCVRSSPSTSAARSTKLVVAAFYVTSRCPIPTSLTTLATRLILNLSGVLRVYLLYRDGTDVTFRFIVKRTLRTSCDVKRNWNSEIRVMDFSRSWYDQFFGSTRAVRQISRRDSQLTIHV